MNYNIRVDVREFYLGIYITDSLAKLSFTLSVGTKENSLFYFLSYVR